MGKRERDKMKVIFLVFQFRQGVTEDAGRIGLVIVISGMAGSMVCGIILDKTHRYKVELI